MTALPARPHLPGWLGLPLCVVSVAALLTTCDALGHVAWGAIRYSRPDRASLFPGQPTGDVFLGFLLIGGFCVGSGWALFRDHPPAGPARALASTAVFAATYLASGAFQDHAAALWSVFLLGWVAHLAAYRHDDLMRRVALSVGLGVLGPLFEGWEAAQGFFVYRDPHAFGVPVWLTGLYLHGGLAVAATVSTVASWRRR